jgi:phage baseplate assembly protein W
VDLNAVVAPNAEVRSAAIPNAAIQSGVGRGVTDAVQNAVIRFEARVVALTVAPNAVTQSVVLNVVQDVARDVVIQCVRYAVDQLVADLDALVDSQDVVLPNDGQGASPVDLLSQVAVQSEVAPDAALFSVPARV